MKIKQSHQKRCNQKRNVVLPLIIYTPSLEVKQFSYPHTSLPQSEVKIEFNCLETRTKVLLQFNNKKVNKKLNYKHKASRTLISDDSKHCVSIFPPHPVRHRQQVSNYKPN